MNGLYIQVLTNHVQAQPKARPELEVAEGGMAIQVQAKGGNEEGAPLTPAATNPLIDGGLMGKKKMGEGDCGEGLKVTVGHATVVTKLKTALMEGESDFGTMEPKAFVEASRTTLRIVVPRVFIIDVSMKILM